MSKFRVGEVITPRFGKNKGERYKVLAVRGSWIDVCYLESVCYGPVFEREHVSQYEKKISEDIANA